jgi:hypothetical protein
MQTLQMSMYINDPLIGNTLFSERIVDDYVHFRFFFELSHDLVNRANQYSRDIDVSNLITVFLWILNYTLTYATRILRNTSCLLLKKQQIHRRVSRLKHSRMMNH